MNQDFLDTFIVKDLISFGFTVTLLPPYHLQIKGNGVDIVLSNPDQVLGFNLGWEYCKENKDD